MEMEIKNYQHNYGKIMKIWLLIALIQIDATTCANQGLIAYDCIDKTVNITSFSLVDVEPCKHDLNNITTEATYIQVVQTKKIFDVHVYQCKVILKRRIQHCGMHSHTSAYQESFRYIVREFSSEECRRLHETGSLKIHNEIYVHELPRNSTRSGEVVIVGQIVYSTCYGGSYYDGIIHYKDALVTMEYEVNLYDYTAKLDISDGTIQFREGYDCFFEPGFCLDSKEGYATWDAKIDQQCTSSHYSLIYEGPANKTSNKGKNGEIEGQNALFSAYSKEQLFSIKVKERFSICGYPGYQSDHDQIFILETSPGAGIIKDSEINAKDLDLLTYFNSKITVVEHHLNNQLSLLYHKLINELCKVEKSLLETRLISARINPHEFASNLMKTSGYTAVIAGEVIYIIQCKPSYVALAPSPRCYQEIPVSKDEVPMYMSPVTHILQRHGTQIECTPLLSAKYKFGDEWYSMDGSIHQVTHPNKLSTETKTNWEYKYLPNLMKSGFYDQKMVQKMHNMIYESEDRRSSSVVLHRTISGYNADSQGFDFSHLINENVFESTITKYWHKILSMTTFVGQFTSSLVGFWLMGKLLKFVIDSMVHGRILFDIYGMSWKLVASFWDSLTNLLTHNYHTKKQANFKKEEQQEILAIEDMRQVVPITPIAPITPTTREISEEVQNNPHVYPLLGQSDVTIQINASEYRPREVRPTQQD